MNYPDIPVVKLRQKNHVLRGKCEVCTAVALWVMEKIKGENNVWFNTGLFVRKCFGSAVELFFRSVDKTPSLGSAVAQVVTLWHSQLSAKGNIFPEAKSRQLGSLFLVLWSIWWNWLRKVPFSPSFNHKFKPLLCTHQYFPSGKSQHFSTQKHQGGSLWV